MKAPKYNISIAGKTSKELYQALNRLGDMGIEVIGVFTDEQGQLSIVFKNKEETPSPVVKHG